LVEGWRCKRRDAAAAKGGETEPIWPQASPLEGRKTLASTGEISMLQPETA
jgi:hypothetical protein